MPRGSNTTKRQQFAANQRGIRHENSLVSPTRPNLKEESKHHFINHTNGHAKAQKSYSSTPSPPASPVPTTMGCRQHAAMGESRTKMKMKTELARKLSSTSSDSECLSSAYQQTSEIPMHEYHRQIDVNAAKSSAMHRNLGPLSFAITVLRSCPLSDTLAIMIVLLQIPPTFLSLIHLLFATLTFVPSSSVAASGLTYTDLLQVTLKMPSLTVIVLLDLVVLLVWLFQRSSIQDIMLDFAQVIIAVTLGGGINGKQAGLKSIFWCFITLGAMHFIRAVNVKTSGLRALTSSNFVPNSDPDDPLEPGIQSSWKKLGLIRSIVAIHILTQGIFRYVRRWYMKREKRDAPITLLDAEAGEVAVDYHEDLSLSRNAENESSTSSTSSTSSNPDISPKKKKKKKKKQQQHQHQNRALVRTRQPLWAALASTKIVMAKEYESSHTAAASAGTNATDLNNLGDAPFDSEAGRIWITYVGSDEIFFSTSFFPTQTDEDDDDEEEEEGDSERESEGEKVDNPAIDLSNVDRSKPFYIRVNNTLWHSTKIYPMADPDQPNDPTTRWIGEIFGLAPTSNYHCDFISTVDDSLLFSSSIRTLSSPPTDLEYSSSTKSNGNLSSPYTTLKASIAKAEKKLADERQRQKCSRKELRAKLNSVRREFERLVNTITSTGSNDDKLKQKAQQSALHMKQADEAAAILVSQIEAIDSIPSDETSLYSKCRSEIQLQREKHKNVRSEYNSSQNNAERDLKSLKSDLTGLQQKSENRKQRLKILNSRCESIADANAKGLDKAQRRESERDAKRKERVNIQAFYTERLHSITLQIYEGQSALHVVTAVIETLLQAQQDMYQSHSPTPSLQNLNGISSSIPEHPSGYPWNTAASSPNVFSGCNYSPMLSTVMPAFKSGHRTRGRSSSMLSNVSKFTQSSDEGPLLGVIGKRLLSWDDTLDDSKYSSGSPSGTGSGTGSVGDPKSPLLVNDKIAQRRQ